MQPVQSKKPRSNSFVFFGISIAMVAVSVIAFAVFANLNRTIKMTSGKVVDSYTKKEFVSRKQTADQEYEVVRYAIDGKEYFGKAASPKTGSSSQWVTVYYYEKFPSMAWYYKKDNASLIFCSLFGSLSLLCFLYSGSRFRKSYMTAAAQKQPRAAMGKKRTE